MCNIIQNTDIDNLIKKICDEKKRLYHQGSNGLHDEEKRLSYYSDYINDINLALNKVSPTYYELANIKASGENDKKMYERMFAYEFYHQLRKIITEHSAGRYKGLHLNGEPCKSLSTYANIAGIINKENIKSFKKQVKSQAEEAAKENYNDVLIPDMILHAPDSLLRQVYVIEIKLSNNKDALSDLIKLTRFKKACETLREKQTSPNFENDPRFSFYIFIYVGDDLKERLKNFNCRECDSEIVCFHRSRDNKFQCSTLGGIYRI